MNGAAPRGLPLPLARGIWVVVSVAVVGMLVAGVPQYWADLQEVCTRGARYCSDRGLLTPQNVRELRGLGLSTGFHAAFEVVVTALFAAVWVAVGVVIFWRRSRDGMAFLVSLMLVTSAVTFSSAPVDALAAAYPGLVPPVALVGLLNQVLLVLFFLLFPSGRLAPRWGGPLGLLYIALMTPLVLAPGSSLNLENWNESLSALLFLALFAGLASAQVYRYRRVSGPEERRQIKWVVLGVAAGIAGFVLSLLPYFLAPRLATSITPAYFLLDALLPLSLTLIPLGIGVAVLRSRLFDIDVVINRALVYASLTVALAGIYFGSVVILQSLVRTLTGQSSSIAVVASTLAIAALFNPLRRRVQGLIDRRFYRGKYDARATLEAFSARLRDEVDLDELSRDLSGVVRRTVAPEHVSLWLRRAEARTGQGGSGL